MGIPFEGILTFFLFIIGVPAFVLQFLTPEERRVVLRNRFWIECFFFVLVATVIVVVAILLRSWYAETGREELLWGWMYLFLFLIAGIDAIYIPNHYGRRERLIKDLGHQASRNLEKRGQFAEKALADLVGLGKQCESGQDLELVLGALDQLVEQACSCAHYRAGMLETVIDETVNMLISRPHPEDFQSFRTAVGLLTRIITTNQVAGESENLIDHQRAVRALSVLGQAVLAQVGNSSGVDYILMGYEEALSLAVLRHPKLIIDVSQALFETGTIALDSKNYLFAVAAMERLLSIVENRQVDHTEASVDMLGLLAHFWTSNNSSRDFVKMRLDRVRAQVNSLQEALEEARMHCQLTMEFETADKIMEMMESLVKEE